MNTSTELDEALVNRYNLFDPIEGPVDRSSMAERLERQATAIAM